MSELDAKTIGSVEHDKEVERIADTYRDSGVAKHAINDYRDFLLESLGIPDARASRYRD